MPRQGGTETIWYYKYVFGNVKATCNFSHFAIFWVAFYYDSGDKAKSGAVPAGVWRTDNLYYG